MKFDIEALKQIPIEEILEALGAKKASNTHHSKTLPMHCFCGCHKNGDKHPSLIVWKDTNICKCMVNPEIKGDAITIVKKVLFSGDFKQACIWLHENFKIPYLEEDSNYTAQTDNIKNKHKNYVKNYKRIEKKVNYIKLKEYKTIDDINIYIPKYSILKPHQKLKLIYSFIYQYSLKTDQSLKEEYYQSRSINPKIEDIKLIGTLTNEDLKELAKLLLDTFPYEDLVEFKILNPSDHYKNPLKIKYITKEAFCVVPNFDINTSLQTGLILRATKTYKWQQGAKEFQISMPNTLFPIPFPFKRTDLKKDKVIITEGHIDTLSLKQHLNNSYAFLAIPGIYNAKEEYLYLLKNKKIYIAFDMDDAGIEGARKLISILDKYTKDINILEWNKEFGKDLNEVQQNGYINYLIEKFELLK